MAGCETTSTESAPPFVPAARYVCMEEWRHSLDLDRGGYSTSGSGPFNPQ